MSVEVGEQAPDFELKDQHGSPVRLSSFRGTKNVVLVFYPLAFSGVCSGELGALRDEFPEVNREEVELLTVSVDSTFVLRTWADRTASTSACCQTSGRTARSRRNYLARLKGVATPGLHRVMGQSSGGKW
jgi:peroxiredoxin